MATDGKPKQPKQPTGKVPEGQRDQHVEEMVDEAVEESFPASDPPSWGGVTGAGKPEDEDGDRKPKR